MRWIQAAGLRVSVIDLGGCSRHAGLGLGSRLRPGRGEIDLRPGCRTCASRQVARSRMRTAPIQWRHPRRRGDGGIQPQETLACLRSLGAQQVPGVALDVFVLDDASSDGTSEAVAEQFPEVTVLHGDGELYWNGGMRRAFAAAIAVGDFDYGLRARAAGCSVWVAPATVGTCASHPKRRTDEQPWGSCGASGR